MNGILLVSSSQKSTEVLFELLKNYAYTDVTVAASGAETRRLMLDRQFDTVIINDPLSDESGDKLAVDIASNYYAGVIMVVKAEKAEMVSSRVEKQGVLVISKPLQRREFFRIVHITEAAGMRIAALRRENLRLCRKLEEVQLIGRVKCLLIEKRGMTEEEAHRYLEREAMDRRCTKKEIATEILYEYN